MPNHRLLPIAAAVLAVACGSSATESLSSSNQPQSLGATIRAINASASQLTLVVDADTLIRGVQVASVSSPIAIAAGTHQVRLVSGSTISAPMTITAVDGRDVVTVGRGAANTAITSSVLTDTGAIVPAGKSKLRVVHLSEHAGDIEIWRTQPDYQTPVHIMTPFAYGAASPYLQSDPGAWEVFVTAAGGTARLVSTGAINIPAGQRRTVVLLDSAGNKLFRVIDE